MKYFWQFFAVILGLAAVIFLFFALSLPVKNNINYTDQQIVTEPEITIADPQIGPTDAKVTLVNYSDYACPACADLEGVLKTLTGRYGTSLRIVWKDMPNASTHPEAISAAVAARCAGKQDKFWEFHNYLMANQGLLKEDFYLSSAGLFKLKTAAFTQCLTNQETLPLVERGYDEGIALQISATPTIFLNGERYTGAMSITDLTRKIDDILNSL